MLPLFKVLSISDRKNPSDKVYSIKAVQGFEISYTHSVNKGRVHDFFTSTRNGDLVVDKTIFVSYGAGIPEPSETSGAIFIQLKDGYEITGLNRRMKQFVMAVGVIAEHSITLGQKEVFLKTLFAPQTSLIFRIKRVSILGYLVNKKI